MKQKNTIILCAVMLLSSIIVFSSSQLEKINPVYPFELVSVERLHSNPSFAVVKGNSKGELQEYILDMETGTYGQSKAKKLDNLEYNELQIQTDDKWVIIPRAADNPLFEQIKEAIKKQKIIRLRSFNNRENKVANIYSFSTIPEDIINLLFSSRQTANGQYLVLNPQQSGFPIICWNLAENTFVTVFPDQLQKKKVYITNDTQYLYWKYDNAWWIYNIFTNEETCISAGENYRIDTDRGMELIKCSENKWVYLVYKQPYSFEFLPRILNNYLVIYDMDTKQMEKVRLSNELSNAPVVLGTDGLSSIYIFNKNVYRYKV